MYKRCPSMHVPGARTSHRCSLPCVASALAFQNTLCGTSHSLRSSHLQGNSPRGRIMVGCGGCWVWWMDLPPPGVVVA